MKKAIVLAIFVAVVAVFFSDVLFGDRVLITSNPAHVEPWSHYASADDAAGKTYRTDAFYTYLPRRAELTRAVRQGRLPLWNPYIFCGTPFFADPQSRVLYPISLLLCIFEPARAMGYDVAIHFLIAMLGMYLFLSVAGASAPGALLGSLLYAFSSFFFLRMGHPTFVASASYIPLLFYGYERARAGGCKGTLLLVVFLVLGYLSGFPQVFMLGVLALLVYIVWDFGESLLAGRPDRALRAVKAGAVAGLLSAAIVAVHLIPFAELIRNSVGLGMDFEAMSDRHIWSPVFLLRSLVPDFFGNPVEGTNWLLLVKQGVHPYNTGFMVYCGGGSIMLLIASLPLAGKYRAVRPLLMILALAVGVAVSAAVFRVAAAVVPLLLYSQIDRIAAVACFALAALSGMVFSSMVSGEYALHRKYFLIVGVPVLIAVLGTGIAFYADGESIVSGLDARAESLGAAEWLRPSSVKLQTWVGGGEAEWLAYEKARINKGIAFFSLAWLFICLLAVIGRRRASCGTGGRMAHCVIGMMLFLCLVVEVLGTARSYYVSQPSRLVSETEGMRFLRELQGEDCKWRFASLTPYSAVLPVNTGQVSGICFVGGRATIVPEAFYDLMAAQGPAGTTGGAGSARRTPGEMACARYEIGSLRKGPGPGPGRSAIYEEDMIVYENEYALPKGFCVPAGRVSPSGRRGREAVGVKEYMQDAANPTCGSVSIVSYEPEKVELRVSAAADCFLVFQDTYYPGWRARVDGADTRVLRTDLGFRSVAVTEGEHEVIMEFRPKSLNMGLILTGAGIALSILYGIKAKARRRA